MRLVIVLIRAFYKGFIVFGDIKRQFDKLQNRTKARLIDYKVKVSLISMKK